MMYRTLLILLIVACAIPNGVSAQLSDDTIEELAAKHADRWAIYLNLSSFRKSKLKETWKKHERRKSILLRTSSNIGAQLQEENQNFLKELSLFITPNELKTYKMIENLKLEDDREYLESLVSALSVDSIFINAYADFQYNERLPFLISIRMELEESISATDKMTIKSIREEILKLYEHCLVTCLANDDRHPETLDGLDELIIVALNKDLSDDQSGLSKLIKLTRKYEDDIHDVYIKYDHKFDSWSKKENELRENYILDAYNQSLNNLKKRNGLSTLKHLESEAIFMLLDPYDNNSSRKFLNLGLRNQF